MKPQILLLKQVDSQLGLEAMNILVTFQETKRLWNVVSMQFRMNSPYLCPTKQLLSWVWQLTRTMFKFFGSNPLKVNIKLLQIRWNIFRLHTLVAMNWLKNVCGENILSPNNTCKIDLRHHQISWMWMSSGKRVVIQSSTGHGDICSVPALSETKKPIKLCLCSPPNSPLEAFSPKIL